jgi:hypothetical protein
MNEYRTRVKNSASMKQEQDYRLGFTAVSLRPELARIIAEAFIACRDWDLAKQRVLADNALQARSPASAIRMEREFRQRAQSLTLPQIEILASAPLDSRRSMAWLSVLKHCTFLFDFAAQVLRGKIADLDPVIRPSDYENFVAAQAGDHPQLASLSASTREKIRRVTKTILREAGILDDTGAVLALQRPVLPPDVLKAILCDDRKWLAGFLVPDAEILELRG